MGGLDKSWKELTAVVDQMTIQFDFVMFYRLHGHGFAPDIFGS